MVYQESTETELIEYFKAKRQKAQAECEREVAILKDIDNNAHYRTKALEHMDFQKEIFKKFTWLLITLNAILGLILIKLLLA